MLSKSLGIETETNYTVKRLLTVWMRELELNSEGAQSEDYEDIAQSEDYEDIQEHEGQDKQNKQGRGDFIQEELYPPSLLGPSQPYRILRDRAPPKLPLPKWAYQTESMCICCTHEVDIKTARMENLP